MYHHSRWCSPRVLRSQRRTGSRRFSCWKGLSLSKQVSRPHSRETLGSTVVLSLHAQSDFVILSTLVHIFFIQEEFTRVIKFNVKFALYVFTSPRDFIFLSWTWAVRHGEQQEVICLWWRCSQARWHPLSVTCRDSEGSKQITFSHLRRHVKLHLIAGCGPLNHDALQDEHFVTDLWNIYRITVSADWSFINWVQLAVTRRCTDVLWSNFLQVQTWRSIFCCFLRLP